MEMLKGVLQLAKDPEVSPYIDAEKIGELMYSDKVVPSYDTERTPEVLLPKGEDPHQPAVAKKTRSFAKTASPYQGPDVQLRRRHF